MMRAFNPALLVPQENTYLTPIATELINLAVACIVSALLNVVKPMEGLTQYLKPILSGFTPPLECVAAPIAELSFAFI